MNQLKSSIASIAFGLVSTTAANAGPNSINDQTYFETMECAYEALSMIDNPASRAYLDGAEGYQRYSESDAHFAGSTIMLNPWVEVTDDDPNNLYIISKFFHESANGQDFIDVRRTLQFNFDDEGINYITHGRIIADASEEADAALLNAASEWVDQNTNLLGMAMTSCMGENIYEPEDGTPIIPVDFPQF